VLEDNALLAFLGRRGRGAVVEILRRHPGRTWTVRELARFADVPSMVASRAVRELAALGTVESLRPGRDLRVRFLPESAAGRWLDGLLVPDLPTEAAAAFARAYRPPAGVTWAALWRHPGDDPLAAAAPVRIALVARDPESALDAADPALDAVRRAGLPLPDVSAWTPESLRGDDPVARAILAGRRILPRP